MKRALMKRAVLMALTIATILAFHLTLAQAAVIGFMIGLFGTAILSKAWGL